MPMILMMIHDAWHMTMILMIHDNDTNDDAQYMTMILMMMHDTLQ